MACDNDRLEIVKFLTTSPELIETGHTFVDIHAKNEQGFQLACSNGHLKIVQFLTTSKELIKAGHSFVDIHEWDDGAFRWACKNSHLDVVKFLTTSKELIEAGHSLVDIHANVQGFRSACSNGHFEIVKFLIFDLKIERTSAIDMIIKDYPQAQELFRVREEQEQIQQSLIESHSRVKNPNARTPEIKSNSSLRI